jgi:hypothetical protein
MSLNPLIADLFPDYDVLGPSAAIAPPAVYGPCGATVVGYLELLATLPGPMFGEIADVLHDDDTLFDARALSAAIAASAGRSGRQAAVRQAHNDGQAMVYTTHEATVLELMDWQRFANPWQLAMRFAGLTAAVLVVRDLLSEQDLAGIMRAWELGLRHRKWGKDLRATALAQLTSVLDPLAASADALISRANQQRPDMPGKVGRVR